MTMLVVVVFVDFVLRCRVGAGCAVGSWQGPKNPFRLPINHPFEGELFGFEGEPGSFGRRTFGRRRRNSGYT